MVCYHHINNNKNSSLHSRHSFSPHNIMYTLGRNLTGHTVARRSTFTGFSHESVNCGSITNQLNQLLHAGDYISLSTTHRVQCQPQYERVGRVDGHGMYTYIHMGASIECGFFICHNHTAHCNLLAEYNKSLEREKT